MSFWLAYLIFSVSCVVITCRTLVAYSECALWIKIAVVAAITVAWFVPMLIWNLRTNTFISSSFYAKLSYVGYFLYGTAFILMMLLIFRDIIWTVLYLFNSRHVVSPADSHILDIANIITVTVAFILGFYAVYEAEKMPRILQYDFNNPKITHPLKIAMISDAHINRAVSADKVKKLVEYVNEQKADMVFLVGDIGDDFVDDIKPHLQELAKLKANDAIYFVLGNHEVYNNATDWEATAGKMGWIVLHNSGVKIPEYGVYIAGIPDPDLFSVNIKQSLKNSAETDFKILLSHRPSFAKNVSDNGVDLMFSGHTHGGQIFPFNYAAGWGNAGFVAGLYDVKNTKLILSRGAGYWGPPMRLFAPSDIIIVNLNPAAD
ncbi:MAG: metallophosphoesterase [Alphaproteobacteria bacterium]|nr:metallophosphoesterase [Alphaproteobacteria bacterium]